MTASVVRVSFLLVALVLTTCASAGAQVLGSFRWQMDPFCNVVTLTVIQLGSTFQLTGTDNLCGGLQTAPVAGSAAVNLNGTIALGFEIVTPSGAAAHVSATVDARNISGTWTDADGNSGRFLFSPGAVAGSPRPAPLGATLITSAQLAASIFAGSGTATTVARSDHTHDDRYYTEGEVATLLAGKANRPEIVTLQEGVVSATSFTFAPEVIAPVLAVTTTVAGRLDIRMTARARYFCSPSADVAQAVYLVVDGVPIRASIIQDNSAGYWDFSGVVTGVTEAVVPAGSHSIGIGAECYSTNTADWSILGNYRGLTVVVLP